MNDRGIIGDGTAERVWLDWLQTQNVPRLTSQDICADSQRLVVIAPHPDDEILACGGLLALRAQQRLPLLVVSVTDGEASHGAASPGARLKLVRQRAQERCAGLMQLGVDPACVVRLQIPDGDAAFFAHQIFTDLRRLLQPGDVLVTTWCLDGHPDHEATAYAALATGCRVFQAPVWMWHWAHPADARVPWASLVAMDLKDSIVRIKQSALARHHSQLLPRSAAVGPVLTPAIVLRVARRQEYFFAKNLPRLKP